MKSTFRIVGLVVLFAAISTLTVQAQTTPAPTGSAVFTSTGPSEAADVNLSSMSAAWWKDLSRTQTRALIAPDEQTRERALQNIIYFATNYPDQADFDRAVSDLLETYILDRDENHRIMALAALHAIGNDAAMRHLVQYVKLERSDRVRRLTMAALADYYAQDVK